MYHRPRRRSSGLGRPRLFFERVFGPTRRDSHAVELPLEAYKAFEERRDEFFDFLDEELLTIDTFYRQKEVQAGKKLQVLRDQLHEMRHQRIEEIKAHQQANYKFSIAHQTPFHLKNSHAADGDETARGEAPSQGVTDAISHFFKPVEKAMGLGPARIGKTSKALQTLGSPMGPTAQDRHQHPNAAEHNARRDYTRRPQNAEITFHAAKRKLKLALQEFYRGLELLKSYALLNRTAFRKINKKYDKAVNARPTQRYMTEKVNKAWFVQSEVLEHYIVAVEDLYARYFERGNRKVAMGKLKSPAGRLLDHSGSLFRSGVMLAAGAVFAIEGVVYATDHLKHSDPKIHVDTSYLMQIYGGYFLMLFLFLAFCFNCKIWTDAKINYRFIFEFDPRHDLQWQQLLELPSALFFLFGLFMWLNFQQANADAMYLYWPVVLVGVSLAVLFFPGPVLYHRSRQWWAYANFRLLFAGLYPVEFRDFFLGDMYCSETYSMGNIALFFCLYARKWGDPTSCNSNHSRLLGFFEAVPGIWRLLQCLRRYHDTRNAFPHLVNCGKYAFNVMTYMTLSLYRVDEVARYKALFVTFATINAVYSSIWDIGMDWSLGNPYAEHLFLRKVLGYKHTAFYYVAMILDPILRFNWIFYAIYSRNIQHSAGLSFFVNFSEVCRRAMWMLFRVENEHCTNVGRFRASRDVPLPYDLPVPAQSQLSLIVQHEGGAAPGAAIAAAASGEMASSTDAVAAATTTSPQHTRRQGLSPLYTASLRSRRGTAGATDGTTPTSANAGASSSTIEANSPITRGIVRLGAAMHGAHAQDFERKRRPTTTVAKSPGSFGTGGGGRRGSTAGEAGLRARATNEDNADERQQGDAEALTPGLDAFIHAPTSTASTIAPLATSKVDGETQDGTATTTETAYSPRLREALYRDGMSSDEDETDDEHDLDGVVEDAFHDTHAAVHRIVEEGDDGQATLATPARHQEGASTR